MVHLFQYRHGVLEHIVQMVNRLYHSKSNKKGRLTKTNQQTLEVSAVYADTTVCRINIYEAKEVICLKSHL